MIENYLMKLINDNDIEKFKIGLKNNLGIINDYDIHSETLLIRAVKTCNLELVKFLVENNADVNKHTKGFKYDTPLRISIKNLLLNADNRQIHIIKYLVRNGANWFDIPQFDNYHNIELNKFLYCEGELDITEGNTRKEKIINLIKQNPKKALDIIEKEELKKYTRS